MKIDESEIKYLENLSKIALTEAEEEICKKDLEKTLAYIDILEELDTENIEALSHSFPTINAMREDIEESSMELGDVLKNAEKTLDGCFLVPNTF